MSVKRVTVDRETIVSAANRMIAHLADSGSQTDAVKREAIIVLASTILMDGNSYHGYRYLNAPYTVARSDGYAQLKYDETRIELY